MNHAQEIFYMVFVPNNQPPEVLKPGKQTLHLPSTPIASQFSAVLGVRLFPSFAMRGNHFDTSSLKESIVKWIAVVRLITNQLIRGILSKAAVYRTQDTFLIWCPHYPGGPEQVGRLQPCSAAAFPEYRAGRHPRLSFRGLLRVHSR